MEGSWQQMAGTLYAMYEWSIETIKEHFHLRTELWLLHALQEAFNVPGVQYII